MGIRRASLSRMWIHAVLSRGLQFHLISTISYVPLRLGLATYCTLAGYFGGFKGRGRMCEIRHAKRVSTELGMGIDAQRCGLRQTLVGEALN